MTTTYDLPMPGEHLHSLDAVVIASCYLNDDDDTTAVAGILLLNGQPPYYTYGEYDLRSGTFEYYADFPNIIPAAEHYSGETGCY
jgi:hypothetical protein